MMKSKKYDILGIGGPILDQILQIPEDYLQHVPGKKGGMEPVSLQLMDSIIHGSGRHPTVLLGGSARNTLHGLTRFGEKCALVGMVGRDARGEQYRKLLSAQDIVPLLIESDLPTATVLSLVTPDGERTMRTLQGASVHIQGKDLSPEIFSGVKLVHIEGYTLYNEGYTEEVMKLAKRAGAKVSFDLASFEIANRFSDHIKHLLRHYVDIIFANEEESMALTGTTEKAALEILGETTNIAVLLMGRKGCIVKEGSQIQKCPAYPVEPIDTTGAGDLFASGFLHAYLQGYPIEICAHYGAIAGRAVVQVIGAEIPHEKWVELFDELKNQN